MSDPVLLAIGTIVTAFVALLIVQRVLPWLRCAICAAVSSAWIILLVAYYLDTFPHPTILAALMGGSAVGAYGAIERRAPERLRALRLPLLLTLMLGAYALLGEVSVVATILVAALWALIALAIALERYPHARLLVTKLIACCRDW